MHYLVTIAFALGALVFYMPALRGVYQKSGVHPAVITWTGLIVLILVASTTPPGTLDLLWGAATFASAALMIWGMHISLHNDYTWKE